MNRISVAEARELWLGADDEELKRLANEVRGHFDARVYQTTVPRNVRLSEAPSHGKPALLYDLRCTGTRSYLAVADEFLDRTLIVGNTKGQPAA